MKTFLIFLLANFVYLSVYSQTGERFNYETRSDSRLCVITLKSEEPISNEARGVISYFSDDQYKKWLIETFHSIVEKHISPEEMQKFIGYGKVPSVARIDIIFSTTGKVVKIRMHTRKENIEIFNEDDLYDLFSDLQQLEIDMSKFELQYPPHWVEGMEGVFTWGGPIKLNTKQKSD